MTPTTEPPTDRPSEERQIRRAALDSEQTIADPHQTAADADQTADRDRERLDRDRVVSEADQRASDNDQTTADRQAGDSDAAHAGSDREGDGSRPQRAESSAARAQGAAIRAQTEVDRFAAAEQRDAAARSRDVARAARDRAAALRDRLAARFARGPEATAARNHAADDRGRSADDRRHAADDREQARVDREQLRIALAEAHFDDLTGTYRRAMGDIALQAEIDRAKRANGRLVLAFVDVDALKEHNDREGHAAGDQLLVDVVASIRANLRSYDPLVRFGGDEFVCALVDVDLNDARIRFEGIQAALDEAHKGASISVGFAQLQAEDTLEQLIARGDAALYNAKQRK
jgi:diguanylate cyclase (GGDEF)-like protein